MKRLILATALVTAAMGSIAVAADTHQVQGKTGISWQVSPDEVVIYLDDKKVGTAGGLKFSDAKPGKHTVKLMRGKDETEMDVVVKKGEALNFIYQFED
jgi:hypothetical protein